jgi:hypothetical protein
MALESQAARTRRAVLVGGLGALAATLASALGRPGIVRAGSDGDVVLGNSNFTTLDTNITNTASGTVVQAATSTVGIAGTANNLGSTGVVGADLATTSGNIGVHGTSTAGIGVKGESSTGPGVLGSSSVTGVSGTSVDGTGVYGSSGSSSGVGAYSNATAAAAARAWSGGNSTGVLGYSGDSLPAAPAKIGVYGEANQDSAARGVMGKSTVGQGVRGEATSGAGLSGSAGMYGYALRTTGRLRFDKVSGVATIAAGQTASSPASTGSDITASSYVLLSPQSDPGTRRFWATLNFTGNSVTIHTNTTSGSSIAIAWLLIR